jgi:hypothetical protein
MKMGMYIFLVEAAAGQEFAVWAKGDAVHWLLVSETEQHIIRPILVGALQFRSPRPAPLLTYCNPVLWIRIRSNRDHFGSFGSVPTVSIAKPYFFHTFVYKISKYCPKKLNYETYAIEEKDKTCKLAVFLRIEVQKVLVLQIV